jgi:hypothetical protein
VAGGERPAPGAPAVELIAPAPGTALVAGGQVAVEWRSAEGAPPRFEEWEVFLSLDGGATWPFRLTQHLDATRRRALVELPPFPTGDARFLFRFGDEREERELELPHAFAIAAASPSRAPLVATPWRLAAGRGEPARRHLPGVAWWIEGPRSGASARLFVSEELAAGLSAGARLAAAPLGLGPAERDGERPPVALPAAVADVELPRTPPRSTLAADPSPPRSSDLLALHGRRNE